MKKQHKKYLSQEEWLKDQNESASESGEAFTVKIDSKNIKPKGNINPKSTSINDVPDEDESEPLMINSQEVSQEQMDQESEQISHNLSVWLKRLEEGKRGF
ncbi:MAG: hypothetical protein O2951_00705 [Bacteroidetes bacterium]|nr:hypothetical protein [Bacteroidota bacterium]